MSIALSVIGAAVGATLLQRLPMIFDLLAGPDNMSEFTSVTRNEFLTLIEDDLLGEPYMPNIMQSALSLVSGYFLSTVALAVDIPGVDVRGTLDRINTMRDPKQSMLGLLKSIYGNARPGTESLELGLPRHDIAISLFNEASHGNYNHCGMESNDVYHERQLEKIENEIDQGNVMFDAKKRKADQDIDYGKKSFNIGTRKSNQDIQNASNRENREQLKYLDDIKVNRITSDQRKELHKMTTDANAERLVQMKESGATKAEIDKVTLAQKKDDAKFASARFDAEKVISDLRAQLLSMQVDDAKVNQGKFGFGKNVVDTLKETTNLAVGKVFDVTFERNGNSKVIPVTVNLAAVSTDAESITDIFTFGSGNNSMAERRFKADAGDIDRGKQLYLLTDMRDEAIRKSIKDKSGFYENMLRRSKGNFWSGLLGLSPSLNNASAVIVASRDTMRNAGLVLGGDFDDYKIREKVFANTASMIFIIVDTKWETVTFYHRNVKTYTKLAIRELSRGQKGGNDDIEGILKAYSAGAAPAVR